MIIINITSKIAGWFDRKEQNKKSRLIEKKKYNT
jgi:hypothetical protein